MANISNMMPPLLVILMSINAIMLFMTFLPADQNGLHTLNYGLTDIKKTELTSDLTGLQNDINGVREGGTSTGVEGTVTARTWLFLIGGLFIGGAIGSQIGGGLGAAIGGIGGAALGGLGIIGILLKYFLLIVFGYFFWIDFFFAPLVGSSFGSAFSILAWGLKFLFFAVQVWGGINILLPIFYAGRRT